MHGSYSGSLSRVHALVGATWRANAGADFSHWYLEYIRMRTRPAIELHTQLQPFYTGYAEHAVGLLPSQAAVDRFRRTVQ